MGWIGRTVDGVLDHAGAALARRIRRRPAHAWPYAPAQPEALARTLRPADVLLVSSNEKVSTAIKYLTQSTWSHAALYVGPIEGRETDKGEPHVLVEVVLGEGCISSPLSKYAMAHTRICRPLALTPADRTRIVAFMIGNIGLKYDLRNIIDLARYLLPTPPVPTWMRRRMIALGSGEPTRAICSSLIAQAFQNVRYPILPRVEKAERERRGISRYSREEILHIRHHSLYTPCDFDLSPYFDVIKPTIEEGFNYKGMTWADQLADEVRDEEASRDAIARDRTG